MAETMATGMPARSISLAIVAPQRLQVPQVETSRQAPTLALAELGGDASPEPSDWATGVLTPGQRVGVADAQSR